MTRVEDVDAHFVAGKRAVNASWSAIARMTGCPELSLRRRFEPGNPAVQALVARAGPATPFERMRAGLVKARFSGDDAAILARMWLANGSKRTAVDLARGVGGGAGATEACRIARRFAEGRGVSFSNGYALTDDGMRRLEYIAGLRDGEGRPVEAA
jgi:hypothetical protein